MNGRTADSMRRCAAPPYTVMPSAHHRRAMADGRFCYAPPRAANAPDMAGSASRVSPGGLPRLRAVRDRVGRGTP